MIGVERRVEPLPTLLNPKGGHKNYRVLFCDVMDGGVRGGTPRGIVGVFEAKVPAIGGIPAVSPQILVAVISFFL